MNYRNWEANRKVFVYPENYLLRRCATRKPIFETLESDLQQGQITDDFVDAAYLRYFDGFRQIAKLRPVDTYYCTVNDPLHGSADTLFLFSRTETSPPKFYFCSRSTKGPWSQWKKVDIDIGSSFVTSLYAFNKLFIFWAELKQSTTSAITSSQPNSPRSTSSNVWRLTINFSFEKHDGSWVAPQALVREDVVFVNPAAHGLTAPAENPFAPLFDMDDETWHKVYVFKTNAGNLVGSDGSPAQFETISILYGPSSLSGDRELSVGHTALGQDNDENAFNAKLYNRVLDANRLHASATPGYLHSIRPHG